MSYIHSISHTRDRPPSGKKEDNGSIHSSIASTGSRINEDEKSLKIREKIYDVNFASKVELQYNSLFDPHLQNFFTSEKRREHLKKIGLLDESGHVLDTKSLKVLKLKQDREEKALRLTKERERQELDRQIENNIKQEQEERQRSYSVPRKLPSPKPIHKKERSTSAVPHRETHQKAPIQSTSSRIKDHNALSSQIPIQTNNENIRKSPQSSREGFNRKDFLEKKENLTIHSTHSTSLSTTTKSTFNSKSTKQNTITSAKRSKTVSIDPPSTSISSPLPLPLLISFSKDKTVKKDKKPKDSAHHHHHHHHHHRSISGQHDSKNISSSSSLNDDHKKINEKNSNLPLLSLQPPTASSSHTALTDRPPSAPEVRITLNAISPESSPTLSITRPKSARPSRSSDYPVNYASDSDNASIEGTEYGSAVFDDLLNGGVVDGIEFPQKKNEEDISTLTGELNIDIKDDQKTKNGDGIQTMVESSSTSKLESNQVKKIEQTNDIKLELATNNIFSKDDTESNIGLIPTTKVATKTTTPKTTSLDKLISSSLLKLNDPGQKLSSQTPLHKSEKNSLKSNTNSVDHLHKNKKLSSEKSTSKESMSNTSHPSKSVHEIHSKSDVLESSDIHTIHGSERDLVKSKTEDEDNDHWIQSLENFNSRKIFAS